MRIGPTPTKHSLNQIETSGFLLGRATRARVPFTKVEMNIQHKLLGGTII